VFLIEIVKYNYIGYEITKFSFILTNNIFIYFKNKYLLAILLAAFFNLCISLGFNNEILIKIFYTSVVLKAWKGILACQQENGRVDWIQNTVAKPNFKEAYDKKWVQMIL